MQAVESRLSCSTCNTAFPFLTERIPVILPDPEPFIANAYLQYEKFLSERRKELLKLKSLIKGGYDRESDVVLKIELAYQVNDKIIKKISDSLKHHLSIENITDLYLEDKAGQQSYMVSFIYLMRDWGWLPNGESEVQQITQHVTQALQQHAGIQDDDNVLFLGAGMGRVASEVSKHFRASMYALDNSITMAYLFDLVQREDLPFYEINLKNVEKTADIAIEHIARSKNPEGVNSPLPDIHYLVGDASKLPFPDNSLSAVVSIFFSDVLPLPVLIKEVRRVLKTNGVFIHLGPLEYHHDDVRFMYSLEETKHMFSKQHFRVYDHHTLVMPHCQVLQTGMFKTYRSWLFVAEKVAPFEKINDSTLVSVKRDMDFFQNGIIGNNTYLLNSSIVLGINDVYEGAETVLDILKIVQHNLRFDEMIKQLSIEYGEIGIQEQEKIKKILLDLANRGVLLLE